MIQSIFHTFAPRLSAGFFIYKNVQPSITAGHQYYSPNKNSFSAAERKKTPYFPFINKKKILFCIPYSKKRRPEGNIFKREKKLFRLTSACMRSFADYLIILS